MTAIWECDFFVMSSFSLQGVPHSHFKLCVERRVEGLSHLLERFPSTAVFRRCAAAQRRLGGVQKEPFSSSRRLLATFDCIFTLLS